MGPGLLEPSISILNFSCSLRMMQHLFTLFHEHPMVAPALGPWMTLLSSWSRHGSVVFSLLVSPAAFSVRSSLYTEAPPPTSPTCHCPTPCPVISPLQFFSSPAIICIVCPLVCCLFSTLERKFWDCFLALPNPQYSPQCAYIACGRCSNHMDSGPKLHIKFIRGCCPQTSFVWDSVFWS